MCLFFVAAKRPNDSIWTVKRTLTVTTGVPYGSDDLVGGLITFTDEGKRRKSTSGTILDVLVAGPRTGGAPDWIFIIFDELPTSSTLVDGSPAIISKADRNKIVAIADVFGDRIYDPQRVQNVLRSDGHSLFIENGSTFYVIMETGGATPTYVNSDDVTVTFVLRER